MLGETGDRGGNPAQQLVVRLFGRGLARQLGRRDGCLKDVAAEELEGGKALDVVSLDGFLLPGFDRLRCLVD